MEGNRKRFSPPSPPKRQTAPPWRGWCSSGSNKELVTRTSVPSNSRGTARTAVTEQGETGGFSGGGNSESWGALRALGEQLTWVKKRTRGSSPCQTSATLQGDTAVGYGARVWPQPRPPPGCRVPPRLTKLPPGIGLRSLAAVAKLHERVQGARRHGQVDGVAEGGAVRGRKGHKKLGIRAWPELSDTPFSPRRAPGLGTAGPQRSPEERGRGRGSRGRRVGQRARAWLSPRRPPIRAGSLAAPGRVQQHREGTPLAQMRLSTQIPPHSARRHPQEHSRGDTDELGLQIGSSTCRGTRSLVTAGGTLLSPAPALPPHGTPQLVPRCGCALWGHGIPAGDSSSTRTVPGATRERRKSTTT